jgi:folate-binding protein YgfZ
MFSYDEYRAFEDGAGLLDRDARGRLRLTGADRRAYLHGLLTNDIQVLSAGGGCYAALLTPQGRMISDMRVSELGDSVLIDLPLRAADAVRSRLADFIFSEDVEVHDVRGSLSHAGLYGPAATAMLASVLTRPVKDSEGSDENDTVDVRRTRLEAMAVNANAVWDFQGRPVVVIRSDDYGVAGFELFGVRESSDALMDALRRAGAMDVSLETAAVRRVEAGRPEFGIDMDEHTIPLEAGIEDRAVSLTKGCYVGQEVIIRVLHRGHGRVAKRLVGIVARADEDLQRGQRLLTTDDPSRDAGEITSVVISPRLRRPIALAYVRRDAAGAGTVLRLDANDPQALVTIVTLPFTRPASG